MSYFEINVLILLVFFGAFQGFILSFILVSTKRLGKTSNRFLALLLFNLSLLIVSSALETLPLSEEQRIIYFLPTFWLTSIPAATLFFIKYLINPSYSWRSRDFLFFVPFMLEIAIRIFRFVRYILGYDFSSADHQLFFYINNVFKVFAVSATAIVLIYAIRQLKLYEQKLYENYADVQDKSLTWLRTTLLIGFGVTILWLIVTVTDLMPEFYMESLMIAVLLGIAILICWIGYCMIIRQDLLETPIFAISESDKITHASGELSGRTDEHYSKLIRLLEKDKIYRNPNLNMSILAERLNLSNGYVSQIINQKEKQNFFDFINSYRVEEVKKHMADSKFDHFTILGIAQEAGFNSKSTFNSVFKKFTHKTPSAYKNELK